MTTDTRADELAAEQAYFDAALEFRERLRHSLVAAPEAAAHPRNAAFVKDAATRASQGLGRPDEAVAFGRIDDEDGEYLYVGVNAIWNDERDLVVMNWQVPDAGRYYTATAQDPQGALRVRQYFCESNTIVSFDDRVFADLAARITDLEAPKVAFEDALLGELDRARTGEMSEIVKTIQAAQYDIIREPLEQLLVVQGGPGTGKTAVALHRVSWLLFNNRGSLTTSDVLVVGPSRAFVRYIRTVLPTLGDEDVQQCEIGALAPAVTSGRVESDELALLKGEFRMAALIERGLRDRIGVPEDQITVLAGQTAVPIDHALLGEQVRRLLDRPYAIGRGMLRDWLRDQVTQMSRGIHPRADSLDAAVDRVWPQLTAPAFVQDLLGSESRLLRAGGDDFSAAEVSLLYRRASARISEERWSDSDLPLLDCAEQAMTGDVERRFKHIVVDEAQDLSPMQLLSIRRRSVDGSMTILGDIAQSTGAWARDDWDDVVEALSMGLPVTERVLAYGYRVPRQIFELAQLLLPSAAPGVTPPYGHSRRHSRPIPRTCRR